MTPFEAQLFYGDLKAIVKTSHLVKIDYPKFITTAPASGLFVKYGIDQQENQPESEHYSREGFAADESVGASWNMLR